MRHLTLILAAFLLTSCAVPFGHPKASPTPPSAGLLKPSGVRCADLVAAAVVSPHAPVVGAYACADAHAQAELDTQMVDASDNPMHINSDAGLQAEANLDPVFAAAEFIGQVPSADQPPVDVELYKLSNPPDLNPANQLCFLVFMAGDAPTAGPDNRLYTYIAFRPLGVCEYALEAAAAG